MPFRATFDCLWCGRPSAAASEADLTGWASLCVDCLERAQDNQFLRYRLRTALRERSARGGGCGAPVRSPLLPVRLVRSPLLPVRLVRSPLLPVR